MRGGDRSGSNPSRADSLCWPSSPRRPRGTVAFTLPLQRTISNGAPVIVVEAVPMQKALSAQRNKTDRNDARGIAHMMRVGWFCQVYVTDEKSQRLRILLSGRRCQVASWNENIEKHFDLGINSENVSQKYSHNWCLPPEQKTPIPARQMPQNLTDRNSRIKCFHNVILSN